mmetsp:Transcript_23543/g.63354  ORF Transcript_23543/g.63354 Transcript_23543/m.63354 type:complete len:305 (-) Transcript_23543:95-1009(-)
MLHWRPAVGMNNHHPNNGIAAEAESEMVSWILRQGFNPSDLRALDRSGRSLWHAAATGRLERCKHLMTRGLGDMISHKGYDGRSPLMLAIINKKEETANWLIDNGADTGVIYSKKQVYPNPEYLVPSTTVFAVSAQYMSSGFVKELADKVAPEHLYEADEEDRSPMRLALRNPTSAVSILKYLILRGVDLRSKDFKLGYRQPRRQLLDWVEAEVRAHQTFVTLVLGCGVGGTRERSLTKEMLTQWRRSGRLSGGPNENQLLKLRGAGMTGARMRIGGFLCRQGEEIKRLRRARVILSAAFAGSA